MAIVKPKIVKHSEPSDPSLMQRWFCTLRNEVVTPRLYGISVLAHQSNPNI